MIINICASVNLQVQIYSDLYNLLTLCTLRRYFNKPPIDSHCWPRAPPDVTYRKREIMT